MLRNYRDGAGNPGVLSFSIIFGTICTLFCYVYKIVSHNYELNKKPYILGMGFAESLIRLKIISKLLS